MKRFYVDTCIWLDLAFDRKDNLRPLGELAFQFFKKCMRNKWKILYYDLALIELGKKMTPEEIEQRCFGIITEKNLLIKVNSELKQMQKAKRIASKEKMPFADAHHALLDKDNTAAIVSRNFHFEVLQKIVRVYLPDEL
jgi:predicted nucleic acid-binding protein